MTVAPIPVEPAPQPVAEPVAPPASEIVVPPPALPEGLVLDPVHIGLGIALLILLGLCLWLFFEWRGQKAALDEQARDLDDLETLREAHLVREGELAGLRATLEQMDERLDQAQSERQTFRARAEKAEADVHAARVRDEERTRAVAQERENLLALRQEVETKFADLANTALSRSQKQFIETANETFKRAKDGTRGDMEKLIDPMREAFSQFREKVDAIEKVRTEDRTSMAEQIKAVQESLKETTTMTGKLALALSAPKGGGRWGEESLRNVLEMAGLSAHADFVEQTSDETERGRQRPDVIIRMPGGREIVVDSKVSIEDYFKASEETDRQKRAAHLAAHARSVRNHVKQLSAKAYWDALEDRVDFVAMFIPGENFYAAALEADRDLLEYASRNRVIIVTPSTLIALAKAVAYGWRQEEAAKNAREVAEMARELYSRLANMGAKIETVGKSLGRSVHAFNSMVGTIETSVMPKARQFEKLGAASDGKELPLLESVEQTPRRLQPGRDLLIEGPDDDDENAA